MNLNTKWDSTEPYVTTPLIQIAPLRQLTFTYDASTAIATSGLSVADVQAAVDKGVKRLRMKDSAGDFRAAVNITAVAAAAPTFSPSSSLRDPVRNNSDENAHFTVMPIDFIRFVNEWENPGPLAGKRGASSFEGLIESKIKALVSWKNKDDVTIVHEIGHCIMSVMDHVLTDKMNIMAPGPKEGGPTSARDAAANKLNAQQANSYSGLTP